MIKVNYDAVTGEIKGYYPDEIGYASIPEPYTEINEDIWKDCINNQGKRKVDLTTLEIVECAPTIDKDEVKKAKLDEINLAFKALRTRIVDQELSIRLDNNDETLIEQELTKLKEEYQTTHQNLLNKQEEILNG